MADLEYFVTSKFADGAGQAFCKDAVIPLDAALDGRSDAFNPAELLLAALSACMTKGALRAAKLNNFNIRVVEVRLKGTRQDAPPRMARIEYEMLVETDEPDRRLDLIHQNVLKFGTVTSTVAAGTKLTGKITRLRREEAPATTVTAQS
jgi:uncharacterized OsmC-like protein